MVNQIWILNLLWINRFYKIKKGNNEAALFIIHTIDLISGYGSVYPTNYNNQWPEQKSGLGFINHTEIDLEEINLSKRASAQV